MSGAGGFEAALRDWLAERTGDELLAISALRRRSEGFSWDTYTLEAAWRDPANGTERREGFAVRIEPRDGLLAPYDIAGQYRLHQALSASTVPVAPLLWFEPRAEVLGMPFYVMAAVRGRVPVQWRPDDPEIFPTSALLRRFALRFVEVHAEIHKLDWQALGLHFLADSDDPATAARAQLQRWIDYYEQSRAIEIPMFREAIAWLRHSLVPSGRLVLCHGDYRIGNVMARDGDIAAVFDWELAHVGDPIEDIAYAGLPLWRGRDPRISHLLSAQEYFERYEAATGLAVDPERYRMWTVFGLLKAGAVHLRGARAFEEGRTTDLRLAALGHQVQHVARQLALAMGLER